MTVETIAGASVELNEEGFLADPTQWNEAVAAELARREGFATLSPRQWDVVHFMRAEYQTKGQGPNVRLLAKASGIPIKELYELFPRGPAKTAAKIAGIPKPRGCI
jgi:tRNA 2-thiouridine synthesizing protein E